MTWENVNKRTSNAWIGVESTFGTTSSNMRPVILSNDPPWPNAGMTTQMLPRVEARSSRRAYQQPVKGLESGSPVTLRVDVKPPSTRLNSAASPVAFNNSAALSHQILWRAAFGGELTPAAGSAVVSTTGTPVTAVEVTSGHGSRFVVGQTALFVTSAGLEPRRITVISTDTLTVSPPLSGTMSVGAEVRNAYNYMATEDDVTTYTVEHAPIEAGSNETQSRQRGCVFNNPEVTITYGQVPTLSLSGTSAAHDGPGDLSLSESAQSDDMGTPFALDVSSGAGAVWLSDSLSSVPSAAKVTQVKLTYPRQWQDIPGAGGASSLAARKEVANPTQPIQIEIELYGGAAEVTAFASMTSRAFVIFGTTGSGSSSRAFGLWLPNTVPAMEPVVQVNGELAFCKAVLTAHQDTLATSDIGRANVIAFWG